MDPIFEQFLGEARDNLAYLDKHLSELKDAKKDDINALFRAAHTLKGGAGLVGFDSVKLLTHKAEDLLDAYRNEKVIYQESLLESLYDAFDEVVEFIDAAEEAGDINIDVDKNRLDELMQELDKFLTPIEQKADELGYESPAYVTEVAAIESIDIKELQACINSLHVKAFKPDRAFIEEENLWIIDMDLDTETIRLGHDPFYALFLLGEENIHALGVKLYSSKEDDADLLDWKTHITVVVNTTLEKIEDALYNLLDEIDIAPLSLEAVFENSYESLQSEAFKEFTKDVGTIEDGTLVQKVEAITQMLSPTTHEGYVLHRLCTLFRLGVFDANIIKTSFTALNINLPKEQKQIPFSEKEEEAFIKILQAQNKILANEENIPHVKETLRRVFINHDIRKDVDALQSAQELQACIHELLKARVKNEEGRSSIEDSKELTRKTTKMKKEQSAAPKTIKIDQEEIDFLMDIVGEIMVMKNALPYIANQMSADSIIKTKRELLGKYEDISRITNALQDRVMGMRLLPISYIFSRYPKLVRETAKALKKSIQYEEYGAETKLDKMMIEKMADPLIHVIRNSLDHGIEAPLDREEKGKDPKGVLKVGAHSEGDKVYIEVSDDGKGIDTKILVHKALEKGLINPESIDEMSEEERLKLIFLPGLSTKEDVTDLSGRGVGADAIRTTVEDLGGKIYMKSKIGEGTTTTLEIPVSVALTNVFHVMMDSVHFGIDMDKIEQTITFNLGEIKQANHQSYIHVRGEIIPIILEKSLIKRDNFLQKEHALILKTKTGKIAFVVDALVGQIDVVQKPLSGLLKNHPLINGSSLLGDGSPLFILSTQNIIQENQ